jgi:hypothetical protein
MWPGRTSAFSLTLNPQVRPLRARTSPICVGGCHLDLARQAHSTSALKEMAFRSDVTHMHHGTIGRVRQVVPEEIAPGPRPRGPVETPIRGGAMIDRLSRPRTRQTRIKTWFVLAAVCGFLTLMATSGRLA